MIRSFQTPMLVNIANPIIKPYSLVTASALCLANWMFANGNPFRNFWLSTFIFASKACSISPKVLALSHFSIFQITAELTVRAKSASLSFRLVFLCVKMSCKQTVNCWANRKWWTLSSDKNKTVSALHEKKFDSVAKKLERNYLNRDLFLLYKNHRNQYLLNPKLHNFSNSLIETDWLVKVSALSLSLFLSLSFSLSLSLSLSLWIFAPQDLFRKFWLGTLKIVSQTFSISPKTVAVFQNSIFEKTAESRFRFT